MNELLALNWLADESTIPWIFALQYAAIGLLRGYGKELASLHKISLLVYNLCNKELRLTQIVTLLAKGEAALRPSMCLIQTRESKQNGHSVLNDYVRI